MTRYHCMSHSGTGQTCTIHVTRGRSKPRAATSFKIKENITEGWSPRQDNMWRTQEAPTAPSPYASHLCSLTYSCSQSHFFTPMCEV